MDSFWRRKTSSLWSPFWIVFWIPFFGLKICKIYRYEAQIEILNPIPRSKSFAIGQLFYTWIIYKKHFQKRSFWESENATFWEIKMRSFWKSRKGRFLLVEDVSKWDPFCSSFWTTLWFILFSVLECTESKIWGVNRPLRSKNQWSVIEDPEADHFGSPGKGGF